MAQGGDSMKIEGRAKLVDGTDGEWTVTVTVSGASEKKDYAKAVADKVLKAMVHAAAGAINGG
jgi:hypothetical protein